jgi:hypothetical protein
LIAYPENGTQNYLDKKLTQHTMEDVFPHKEGVDYAGLRLTPEGFYSVTKRRDGQRLIAFMRQMIPDLDRKMITDATACVGGDTLLFSLWFKRVESIEWKNDNFSALQNNVNVFGAVNVNLHKGDATQIFNWRTNVLYIDPPWGGPDYLARNNIDLWMGNSRVDDWIEEVLKRNDRPEYIFIKLPRNYNFSRLRFQPNVEETHYYHIRNFVVVLLRSSL